MKKLMTCAFAAVLTSVASAIAIYPDNNAWIDAEELDSSESSGYTLDESNADATEPQGDPLCALGDYGKTLWYKWTAPFDGTVQFSTKGSFMSGVRPPPQLDTVMCVFMQDSQGVLEPVYTATGEIAFNDDAATDKTSFVELQQVFAGETYYIGVGTKSGATGYVSGSVRMNWSYVREMARVRFNPQGGTTTSSSVRLLGNYPLNTFGDLPVPVRGGYDFIGWFSLPSGGVRITGAERYEQLKDYISEGVLDLYAQWKLTGLETPQFGSFDKAQIFNGALLTVTYGLVGSIQIKAGKKSSKGVSRLSVYVTRYDTGKKFSAKGSLTFRDDGSATSDGIAVKFKDESLADDVMYMTVNPDGTFAMKGDRYLVEAAQVGGALTAGSLKFEIPTMRKSSQVYQLPVAPVGFKVIEEALPDGFRFSVSSNGQKFSFPAGKALSYKANKRTSVGRAVWSLQGLDDSNPNKPQLKLSYNAKSGLFKGKFKVYMTNGASYISNGGLIEIQSPKLQKYTVNVVGLVLSGRGFGMSTLKSTNQRWVSILNK